MADTVTLDPGTGGAVVATDDLGATGHVQLVKLVDGTDNASGRIAGDATNGLDVDVTRSALPTGAATAAKQPALGTAGSASTDVITVQGIASGTAQPVSGTVTVQDGGSTISVDDGAGSLTVDGTVEIGATSLAALESITVVDGGSSISVDDNGGSLTVDGTVAVSGTVAVTDNSGSLTVDGTVAANVTPNTSGGLSISRVISAASTNATSAKGSAGQVFGYFISNTNAAARYLKLYNKASAPTVGTDTPVMTILIPGNTAGAGANVEFTNGVAFGTGIAFALTTGVADSDTAAVAANEIVVNLLYK